MVERHFPARDAHLCECFHDAKAKLLEGPYCGSWDEVGPTKVSATGVFREGVLPNVCGLVSEANRAAS